MASLNTAQENEVSFLSGITAGGTLAGQSFWTWNGDSPATYDAANNYTAKFGSATAGTGATISYAFAASSNWTATEKAAFSATAALWSAVANVTFTQTSSTATAKVVIDRASDGSASGGQTHIRMGTTGTTTIGTATSGSISIDTSVAGFGPIGGALSNYGGYPWTTVLHEWGHVLGLGHGGAYDEGLGVGESAYTAYDYLEWTIMSYNDPESAAKYAWGTSLGDNGKHYANAPTTWMPLDIVAIQRMYGVAVNTPLSGGQTFGFNSNVAGEIAKFFDFTQNTKPIVTLWDKGLNNTLDLSGFSQGSTVDLHEGAFSSAGGLTNNIAIAYDTRIDTAITGAGADKITANDNSDVIMGGAGADTIVGGAGNDHLYGGGSTAVTGDTADHIDGGAGSDYLQGNAGNDTLDGGDGSDRIYGGQGDDSIRGGAGNDSINGNLGNDNIDGGDGNDQLRGGQGNDTLVGGAGDDSLVGDLGVDTLKGGAGIDVLTGGGDADVFVFGSGDATFTTSGSAAGMTDVITDFADGVDHIRMSFGVPAHVLHGADQASFAAAADVAQQMLDAQGGGDNVAALKVGSDVYIFYDLGVSQPLEAFKLAGLNAATSITSADFVA